MGKIASDGTPSSIENDEVVTNAVGEQFDLGAEPEDERDSADLGDAQDRERREDDGEDSDRGPRPANETPAFTKHEDTKTPEGSAKKATPPAAGKRPTAQGNK